MSTNDVSRSTSLPPEEWRNRKEGVMSATLAPSTPASQSPTAPRALTARPAILRPIFTALAVFVAFGGMGLGIALITGATVVFNVLVFTMFAILWIAFAAALAFSPGTVDDLWLQTRRLPLLIQGVVWLLFLPLMIGLWIWERTWSLPIRLVLIIAIGVWNVYMFFPLSL
jgi:hypothetical protein